MRFDTRDTGDAPGPEFEAVLGDLLHFDSYEQEVLFENDVLTLGQTSYPSYPVATFDDEDFWVYLEGHIYDRFGVAEVARSLAPRLFDDEESVAEWLRTTDGDFLVCAVEKKSGDVAVLNDLFGRLPLYYFQGEDYVYFGREARFVVESLSEVQFDRHAIAQYLLFGYPLGTRTLWADVHRAEPATLVRLRRGGEVSFKRLHTFNFDTKAYGERSVSHNASALASRLVDALRNRSGLAGTDVLSLSGGHDSRAVAAASQALSVPPVAATFVRQRDGITADAELARDVANELGLEWDLYRLSSLDTDDIDTLLDLKYGLNPLGMGFILEFFEALHERHGQDITYITGDGGDKTLPSLQPARTFDSFDDLVSYTISLNSVFSLEQTAHLTGLSESAIVDEVSAVLSTYPEVRLENRYIHFLVHERGMNWLFEGEDRNRYYFWSTSPFYSTQFFQYAMNVPDSQKAHDRLYREFLANLWPQAVEIANANYGVPISSSRYRLVMHGLEVLGKHPKLWDIASTLNRGEVGYEYPEPIQTLLAEQLSRCESISEYLSTEGIRAVIDGRRSYGSKQIFNLLTVTSAIDRIECEDAAFERPSPVSLE